MLLDGREGNLMLVNGKQGGILDARAGESLRIRLVNAANARFMRLSSWPRSRASRSRRSPRRTPRT
ncbi:MAG: hypothetical protein ACR2HM_02085 [Acidimicrobiales bacterium]